MLSYCLQRATKLHRLRCLYEPAVLLLRVADANGEISTVARGLEMHRELTKWMKYGVEARSKERTVPNLYPGQGEESSVPNPQSVLLCSLSLHSLCPSHLIAIGHPSHLI